MNEKLPQFVGDYYYIEGRQIISEVRVGKKIVRGAKEVILDSKNNLFAQLQVGLSDRTSLAKFASDLTSGRRTSGVRAFGHSVRRVKSALPWRTRFLPCRTLPADGFSGRRGGRRADDERTVSGRQEGRVHRRPGGRPGGRVVYPDGCEQRTVLADGWADDWADGSADDGADGETWVNRNHL